MPQLRQEGDLYVTGNISGGSISLSSGAVTNSSVVANAGIERTKVVQQLQLPYAQAPGSDIATATLDLYLARAAGTVVSVEAAVTGVAATGDRSVTVDVHKSTGGGAFATILSAPITLDIANALRVLEAGTVSSAAYVDGDLFRMIVTQVAGTTGTRPQGLIVTTTIGENPQ